MMIYKSTGRSLRASYLFAILTFVFILYSTFLTRTGILGDTSVHAFTEAGKAINIMIGLLVLSFAVPALTLFFINYKKIPAVFHEEETQTREFFMFIGSLILFLSSIFIIVITSIPVFNKTPYLSDLIVKLHNGPLALPEDPEFLYNKIMIIVTIFLGFLMSVTHYFKYKSTPKGYVIKTIKYPFIASIIICVLLFIFYPLQYEKHGIGFLVAIYLAFFYAIYSVIANAMYIPLVLKNNFKNAGGSIAHAGFAIMIVGMIISSSNKTIISDSKINGITLPMGKDPMTKKAEDPTENLTLIRQVPTKMADYSVTYTKDSAGNEKGRKYYLINFERKDKNNKSVENFRLEPDVYLMKDNNMSSNPDTKSYLTKDVFTYISYAINQDKNEDTAQFKEVEMEEGEKQYYSNGYFILNKVIRNPVNEKYQYKTDDLALMADITFVSKDSMHYKASPLIQDDSLGILYFDDTVYAQNLYVKFVGVGEGRKVKIGIKESDSFIDFVSVKSFIFPYINLVWLGLIVMAFGILLSMIKRSNFSTKLSAVFLIVASAGLIYMFLLAN